MMQHCLKLHPCFSITGGHLLHFKNDVQHNIGRIKSICIKIIKEFQIMRGPLKVDNLVTSMIDRCKIWAIPFSTNNIGDENKDPRMYV